LAFHLQWVVSSYSLAYGGFLLIGGRLSDVLGRRRMFMVAISLFGVGSLLGGLAESQFLLIVARGIQGLGGALLSPATLSLIMSSFAEGAERNRALSVWGAMGGVGLSLGLLLGGVLTSYSGWEATFYVNVPIALLILVLSPFVLQESRLSTNTRHYDIAGTLSVTTGMLLVVYYLIQSPIDGWLATSTFVPGLLGVGFLLLFVWIEKRTKEPLIPLRLFRLRSLTGATLTAVLFSASFGTLYYFLTLYTQEVLHYTAVQSGLSFLPLTLSALLGAKFIHKMVSKIGVAGTIASGMVLGAIGFLLLTRLSETGTAWELIPGMVIIGLGQAFVFTSMYIASGSDVEPTQQGVASAIVSTGQQIGSAIGLAVILAVIFSGLGSNVSLETMGAAELNQALRMAYISEAVIAVIGILIAFVTKQVKSASSAKAPQALDKSPQR
jgi:EmrB/QacA subfamily drug resistance transporter